MNYVVVIFDENDDRVAVLENATNPTYNRAKNSADQVSISVPRTDPKISEVQVGRRFEVLRGGIDADILETSGYISERGYTEDEFEIDGYTEEIVLERYLTPANFGYPLWSENQNLYDFFRQFDRQYRVERVKRNWADKVSSNYRVDYTTHPDFVLLEGIPPEEEGGRTTYPENGWFSTSFSHGGSYYYGDITWDRIRWVSDYDEEAGVWTTIETRQASKYWGGVGIPGAMPDVVGIPVPQDNYPSVGVRINFFTEVPDASPVLYAIEAIWREPIPEISRISFGDIETENKARETSTPHIEANNKSFLDVLVDVCDETGWEFRLQRGVLYFSDGFGRDRTNEYSLVES